jgi:hypothetical protein
VLRIPHVGHRGRADDVAEHERHLAALRRAGQERRGFGVLRIEDLDRGDDLAQPGPVAGLVRAARVAEQIADAFGDRVGGQRLARVL